MRTEPPILLPLFRSRGQARLLTRVFLHPDDRVSLNQLARDLDLDPATVQREAARLEEAGIFVSERAGGARFVTPNEHSPFFGELSSLIMKAFGPVPILREALSTLDGVDAAFVYGSWAERYAGTRGATPGDIDLLVVGRPDRRALARIARQAGERVASEVDPTVVTRADWDADASGFIRQLKAGVLIPLTESAVAAVAADI